jgi:ABC-2 type transport system ATP-binding protein
VFRGIDQNGKEFTSSSYPMKSAGQLKASGKGKLNMVDKGGAGPAKIPAGAGGLGPLVASITPAKAKNAVNVPIRPSKAGLVVGAPTVKLSYKGKIAGKKPARAFAQLVDEKRKVVIGNHVTPIPLVLDGKERKVSVRMETIAQRLAKGDKLTLQIIASNVSYAKPRFGGKLTLTSIDLTLPLVKG